MPFPEALLEDPLYPRLKEHVVESTGLAYYAGKDADLVRRLGRRILTTGIPDCSSYLDLLRDPVRGPAELDALIAEITIGETYFFRHEEHFDALRDVVLPDLIARNRERRSLRIWSAGCADGPEPYSLAMLLKRSLAHELLGWTVSILGTDINRSCLARAREGKFEEWALRATPESLKSSCFGREGKRWVVAPEYKEGVSFQYHNLAEHHFPSLVNNLSAFDLIICRNVMIYFGPDLMQKMIRQFHECLLPGGWLLVGPTEPNMTHFTQFRVVNAPGVTLYQKEQGAAPATTSFLPSIPMEPVSGAAPVRRFKAPVNHGSTLSEARQHADRGKWEDAARCCDELIRKNNLDASAHFYRGLVLEHMKRHAEAEQSLRRAIYLDRKAVLTHYYLGLFLQARGELRRARRSFDNVLELLIGRDDSEIFVDADGITVAELKKLAQMQSEIFRESA